ncbi:unnamed protein product [Acidithrix sp. C25]|nr:unnamed protein product [Acidithrix sp. C25]
MQSEITHKLTSSEAVCETDLSSSRQEMEVWEAQTSGALLNKMLRDSRPFFD